MENIPSGAENDPSAPWNDEEIELCNYCGESCTKSFCDKDCEKAYIAEN